MINESEIETKRTSIPLDRIAKAIRVLTSQNLIVEKYIRDPNILSKAEHEYLLKCVTALCKEHDRRESQ